MGLIPTYCDACCRSALVDIELLLRKRAECTDCGGRTRALPGLIYGGEDRALFSTLSDTFKDAGVSAVSASHVLAQLHAATLRDSPGETLHTVARALPRLWVLERLASEPDFPLRKAEAMLVTIVAAHATGRREPASAPGHPRTV